MKTCSYFVFSLKMFRSLKVSISPGGCHDEETGFVCVCVSRGKGVGVKAVVKGGLF